MGRWIKLGGRSTRRVARFCKPLSTHISNPHRATSSHQRLLQLALQGKGPVADGWGVYEKPTWRPVTSCDPHDTVALCCAMSFSSLLCSFVFAPCSGKSSSSGLHKLTYPLSGSLLGHSTLQWLDLRVPERDLVSEKPTCGHSAASPLHAGGVNLGQGLLGCNSGLNTRYRSVPSRVTNRLRSRPSTGLSCCAGSGCLPGRCCPLRHWAPR